MQTIVRTIALVNCLARLHNFCINEVERTKDKELDEDALPTDIEHMMNGPEGYFPCRVPTATRKSHPCNDRTSPVHTVRASPLQMQQRSNLQIAHQSR